MQTFDDLVRALAYKLWEGRGRPSGSDQEDWFAALSLLNATASARADVPSAFFHCFTRSRKIQDAHETLRLMLDIGMLLTPEQLSFYPNPTVTQSRLSLAFIPPHELSSHSVKFGPYALKMASYQTLAGEFGASPVWYLPSFIKKDAGANTFRHGAEVVEGLARMQQWIHDMRNDPAREQQRHEPHRTTRLCLRLMYPTHYKDSTDIRDLYFMQREWRIVRRDSTLDRVAALSRDEQQRLLRHNHAFFSTPVKVWSESAGTQIDVPRVQATVKLDAGFADLVSEIIVPAGEVEKVSALNPPVPVVASERYDLGFHP